MLCGIRQSVSPIIIPLSPHRCDSFVLGFNLIEEGVCVCDIPTSLIYRNIFHKYNQEIMRY